MKHNYVTGDTETATILENKGVDINAKDNEGKSALDIAEMNRHPEMMNFCKANTERQPVEVSEWCRH